MGMRFDKVKTSDWVNLGNAIGGAYVKGQAGEANAEGMRQSTQTTSDYGAVDPNAVYAGPGADGAMTNSEAASYGVSAPTNQTRQYGLGKDPQQWQDAEYTPDQKRIGGLRAQMAYYDGRGQTDESDRIRSQIDAGMTQDREKTRFDQEQKAYNRNEKFWDEEGGGAAPAPQGGLTRPVAPAQGSGQGTDPQAPGGLAPQAAKTEPVAPRVSKEMLSLQRDLRMAQNTRSAKDVTAARKSIDEQTFIEALDAATALSAKRPLKLKEAGAQALSDSKDIPGKLIVTGAEGKDPGSIVYITPGGEPVKISHEEADRLAALRSMRDEHPQRVAAEIAKMEKNAQVVAAALFDRNDKTAGRTETNRHNVATEKTAEGQLGVARTNAATNREYKDGMLKLNGEKAATKGTGRPRVSIQKNEDGSFLALNQETGEPVYNMDSNGRKLPIGMSATQFVSLQATAKKAGVRMVEGYNEDGSFAYGYEGADGEMYSDPAEAAGAGSATKPADKKPGLPPPVGGLKPPGAPAATNRPKDFYADPARAGLKTTQAQADAARLAEIADDEAYAKRLQQMRAEGKIKTNPATLLARPQ